jgi:cobalt-zinc-cadmium efflux system protein
VLITGYLVVEVVDGLISGGLALLADAGHILTDSAAIGLALLAIWISRRPPSIEQAFHFHRTEILAAMLNALSLWLIAALIFFEASRRFDDSVDIDGNLMLAVGQLVSE